VEEISYRLFARDKKAFFTFFSVALFQIELEFMPNFVTMYQSSGNLLSVWIGGDTIRIKKECDEIELFGL
jgi:hypothetical protein